MLFLFPKMQKRMLAPYHYFSITTAMQAGVIQNHAMCPTALSGNSVLNAITCPPAASANRWAVVVSNAQKLVYCWQHNIIFVKCSHIYECTIRHVHTYACVDCINVVVEICWVIFFFNFCILYNKIFIENKLQAWDPSLSLSLLSNI